jgi:hypothetical protein
VRVTPVRVVCQNTLVVAKAASSEAFRVVHDRNVEHYLAGWLAGIVGRAEGKSRDLKTYFDLMSFTNLLDGEAENLLERIYVDPDRPRYVPDANVMQEREKVYETLIQSNRDWRERVMVDWQGAGVGMDSPATQGTAYGLYNAVVEVEDYRPYRSRSGSTRGYNVLFGERAKRKELAYSMILDYALDVNT